MTEITVLAKDDLMAMMVLKELHRRGVVIEGFVANLGPPISPVSMIGNKMLNTSQGTARHSIQKLAPWSPNDTLIEWFCDLGRYRVAIAVDYNWDKEGRTRLARYWCSVTFETAPPTSRLYHHLARLARPIAQQPVFNSQFTSAEDDNLTRCEALNQETYDSQPWDLFRRLTPELLDKCEAPNRKTYYSQLCYPYRLMTTELLDNKDNWELGLAFLKARVGLTGKHMGGETRKPLSGSAPFSEDFARRSVLWRDEYYRDSWSENEEINEEQKYHELASMTEHREERILWLAGRGYLIYDPP
jgi:hypothetical protein